MQKSVCPWFILSAGCVLGNFSVFQKIHCLFVNQSQIIGSKIYKLHCFALLAQMGHLIVGGMQEFLLHWALGCVPGFSTLNCLWVLFSSLQHETALVDFSAATQGHFMFSENLYGRAGPRLVQSSMCQVMTLYEFD